MLIASKFCLAFLIGGMVFFPAVVAPRVFKSLDGETAGKFLRDLFPAYYAYIILLSALASIALSFPRPSFAVAVAIVSLSTLWVRQGLMPRINRYRDQEKAGDALAGLKFKKAHRLSVGINLLQLACLIAVFAQII